MRTIGGRAMEMPRLRKATKNVAFLSRLEKSGKEQPDFPTFPQLLLLDSYYNLKEQNRTFEGVNINHKNKTETAAHKVRFLNEATCGGNSNCR
jgi:hypothetical protein